MFPACHHYGENMNTTLHLPTIAQKLLSYCQRHHLSVEVRDGELFMPPWYVIHDQMRNEMIANKQAVIEELQRRAALLAKPSKAKKHA